MSLLELGEHKNRFRHFENCLDNGITTKLKGINQLLRDLFPKPSAESIVLTLHLKISELECHAVSPTKVFKVSPYIL